MSAGIRIEDDFELAVAGEGEEAAARWVEARCREMGLDTHFEFVEPGRPNVIALLAAP